MNKLGELLSRLADGDAVDDAWKPSGFRSLADARRAVRSLAKSLGRSGGSAAADSSGAPAPPSGDVDEVIVYADGASRGNPGPSAVAAVAYLPSGDLLTSVSRAIDSGTNNVAEYRAVLEGLTLAQSLGVARVVVRLDSQLVVRQLSGEYRIKSSGLRPLANAVRAAASRFTSCTFEHIPRAENAEADRLANKALDDAKRGGGP